jgi:PKD repeat protein
MENSGQLTFGVWTGFQNTITSPQAYNNGQWHHMVATQSSTDGMKLYVDGVLVGTNSQTQAQDYTGYWRVGGDSDWGGDSPFFDGVIDEVAIYSKVLGASSVSSHYTAGGGQLPNVNPHAAFSSTTSGRVAHLDGTGSNDTDGSVASFDWDFGDGSPHGTGSAPDHTYAADGTYTVVLKVTDDRGGIDTISHDVTVANAKPTARFTSSSDLLVASLDGTTSTDSDGTVASYSWNWGDSTANGSGATPAHTYGAAGTYSVTLTVTDNDGGTDSVSHDVTVTSNQAPTARFTSTIDKLKASVDGTTSSDPDGTLASYSWSWGDGSPDGSGGTPSHTYATDGTYTITLRVTDNRGATDTVAHDVTVAAPVGPTPLASDTFERTQANGWGSATTGGTWVLKGAANNFSVSSGAGVMTLASAGAGPWAYLNGVSSSSTDSTVTLSANKPATGTGFYAYLIGRELPTGGGYRAALNLRANGTVSVVINRRTAANVQTAVAPAVVVPGLTWGAGDKIKMRFVADGNGTTALKVKVWAAAASEPAAWLVSTTDSTADMQGAGSVGLMAYLATNVTNAPVAISFDDYAVATAN